jgi:hypothetical protein
MQNRYLLLVILVVLGFFFITACGSSPIDKNLGALSCVPDQYKSFFYFKNFPRIKAIFEESEFSRQLKENYVYLDLKYKYSQSVDLFFVRFNFDLEELLKRINKDALIGFTERGFFIVASLDYQSQLIYSLFNLLPDTAIKKSSIMGQEVGSFTKNGEEIYFTFINDYLIISGDRIALSSILDGKMNKAISADTLLTSLSDEDIFIRTSMPKDYNPFEILPHLGGISIKLNFNTFKAQLEVESTKAVSFKKAEENLEFFQFLKYLPPDFSLMFFNREYGLAEVLRQIFSNYKGESEYGDQAEENIKELKAFDNFSDGAYFSLKSLDYRRGGSEIEPNLAFALRLKKGVTAKQLSSLLTSVFRVFNFLFGFSGWDKSAGKNYTLYSCRDNDFYIIASERFFILCTSKSIMEDISKRIETAQPSLYDKLVDNFKTIDQEALTYYMSINMQSLFSSLEPIFADYIQSRLDMEMGEYRNSFGQFLDFLKQRKPLFATMQKDKKQGQYSGEIRFID